MSFGRKSKKVIGGGGAGDHDDLNITPLLDLFVALIAFLIIGSVMTKINIVEVGVAKPVRSIARTDSQELNLIVEVGLHDAILKTRKGTLASVKRTDDKQWLEEIHEHLVTLKKSYPHEFKIRLKPEARVNLNTMMSIMDVARELKKDDPEIIVKDEQGEKVKLQYLFPNVILSGVY